MTRRDKGLARMVRVLGLTLGPAQCRPRRSRQLSRAYSQLLRRALDWNEDGNILGFGIGAKRVNNRRVPPEECLTIFVATKRAQNRLRGRLHVPASVVLPDFGTPVPTDIIEIGELPAFQMPGVLRPGADAAHFTMRAGTVTAMVRSVAAPGGVLVLSCAHGFAPFGVPGREIESPPDPLVALSPASHAANVLRAAPLRPGAASVNTVDAALAVPLPGVGLSDTLQSLGRIALASPLESGEFARNGVRRFVGVGATSGRVACELIAERVSTLLRDHRGNVFRFGDVVAYKTRPATQAGDSGMPLVTTGPAGMELLGMHIGSSQIAGSGIPAAFFVPISRVMARLQIRLA